jgi:aryl-alcohol dehydrogenase-like predicted oxidoreductase
VKYRPFCRTGVMVSPLALGAMMLGTRTGRDESFAIIDRALDAGINLIDTANVYGRGASEETVGAALARDGKRKTVVLATKVHTRMDDTDPNAEGLSRRHVIEQCEESLRRLGTDYIDVYQLHRRRSAVPIDETLRALDDLVRAGKVRYIGTSTFPAWTLVEALWVSKELGLNRFVSEQPPYNLLDRRAERELLPMAATYGFAVIPWSPLGGGLLTGKYTRESDPPHDSRFAHIDAGTRRRLRAEVFDLVDGLQPLAAEKSCSLAQLAVAWCVSRPGVTSPIVGPRTLPQLEDYLGSLDVEITPADEEAIDRLSPPGGMLSPFYEADQWSWTGFSAASYHW